MTANTPGALTPEQIAARWQVHPRTVQRLCESGKLRGFRIGDLWRVSVAVLAEYEGQAAPGAEAEPTSIRTPKPTASHETEYVAVVKGPVPWRPTVLEDRKQKRGQR